MAESTDRYTFKFLRNCQTGFQSAFTILHSHLQWMSNLVFTHPSALVGLVILFFFSYSNRCVVVSYCFNLHFTSGCWSQASSLCLFSFHKVSCSYSTVIAEWKCPQTVSRWVGVPLFQWNYQKQTNNGNKKTGRSVYSAFGL